MFDLAESPATTRAALRRSLSLAVLLALSQTPVVQAGDILRGGSPGSSATNAPTASTGRSTAISSKALPKASDALVRTTQALKSVQNLQVQARRAAISGSSNLGRNPNFPNLTLPNVPDGLTAGGLVVNAAKPWQGATLKPQSVQGGKTVVTINQNKSQALLHWQTFNVGKKTEVNFDQSAGGKDTSKWIAFNKIEDPSGNPTQILGSIKAQGQVYLINQNGIIFGGSSQVNTHNLTASSLPINDNLISRGLLNNPDQQFLFSALPLEAGANGTPAFIPANPLKPDGIPGDVVVQPGAQLSSPTNSAKVGGRIALIGANVRNEGTISTPDGQTILAAGLQVGLSASSDKELRGLDVFIGKVANPGLPNAVSAGSVMNAGLIDVPRANVTFAGKTVRQDGVIQSSTSVSLNGSVRLLASYDAVGNPAFDAANSAKGLPFLSESTGAVEFGKNSATSIVPELTSQEKVIGTALALRSQVEVLGQTIHLENLATVLAPNAEVELSAGRWNFSLQGSPPTPFAYTGGQIYLDAGAEINVAGTTGVSLPVTQNILEFQVRGAELADSPVQRDGLLRGTTIQIDIRNTGTYNGYSWVGTPLANAAGYVGLIQRSVGELTTEGGTVSLSSGGAVILQTGARIDVSGGSINYEGGMIKTTRVTSGGLLFDLTKATPDQIYDGFYTGTFTTNTPKYGLSETFTHPLALTGEHWENSYVQGANGGTIKITAPSMALDGTLLGRTESGSRQRMPGPNPDSFSVLDQVPLASSLSLIFKSQDATTGLFNSPNSPSISFESGKLPAADSFALTEDGAPVDLREDRKKRVVLSAELVNKSGFGILTIDNSDGQIDLPSSSELRALPGSVITLKAANISISGKISAPGGTLTFQAGDVSPYSLGSLLATPAPNPARGNFTLASTAILSTAGLIIDDRNGAPDQNSQPLFTAGGTVSIKAFNTVMESGGRIDVSGGAVANNAGEINYGNAGNIEISGGQDPLLASLIGGHLRLGTTLTGFSGGKGGSLSILAPAIQVGGSTKNPEKLLLAPDFFSKGGFGSFTLIGLGQTTATANEFLPGVLIAPGTRVAPRAESWLAIPGVPQEQGLTLAKTLLPEGYRTPVSLTFSAPGVTDSTGAGGTVRVVRGDIIFGEGASVLTDPRASVSLLGNTVSALGSIIAPSGTITIGGLLTSSGLFANQPAPAATVVLGRHSVFSSRGTTLLTIDPTGKNGRVGSVLDGGSIIVSGNVVAEAGALLDVSGTSDTLDFAPAYLGQTPAISFTGQNYLAMRMDSSGGTISLNAGANVGQMLFTDATLRGEAGGPTAQGGSLALGAQFASDVVTTPLDATLIVTQHGSTIPKPFASAGGSIIGQSILDENGVAIPGLAHFAVDKFTDGGFDSLALQGSVQFSGPVTIDARRSLIVGTKTSTAASNGGVILADSEVRLSAPYVALGQSFQPPTDTPTSPYASGGGAFYFSPNFGTGSLTVHAQLIDVGNLSLQNIGQVNFIAENGDIRGNGTLNVAGEINLLAGQIYPTTGSAFTIAAFDHDGAAGLVRIVSGGNRQLPLSAGGTLNLYGSVIQQGGVLRAPFGTINLGWDGTGVAPTNPISNQAVAITQQLSLQKGSITSVAAIDPSSGKGLIIPFGLNVDGTQWIAPSGIEITTSGGPAKTVNFSAVNLTTATGSTIDLSGGGDLYAYRFIPGNGGSRDILASDNSFAIIPGYQAEFAPYAPNNPNSSPTNLASFDPGYVNDTLSVGERVWLEASPGLAEGFYTLLPARYALLPGAFLLTPENGLPFGTQALTDGASLVSGHRMNSFTSVDPGRLLTRFEVAPQSVIRARSEFEDTLANPFFAGSGQQIPDDAGQLVLSAVQSLALKGSVLTTSLANGHGALIDISSSSDIFIGGRGTVAPLGSLMLDASTLSGFGAESLLIGGVRRVGTLGTTITVKTGTITLDNQGSPLTGAEIILASRGNLTLADGAEIFQSGASRTGGLLLGNAEVSGSGDGALLWVSGSSQTVTRAGVSSLPNPKLSVGAGANISGESVTLDSTAGTILEPSAGIVTQSLALNSGRISIQFESPGVPLLDASLLLEGDLLAGLQSIQNLSLLSYSSIDIYGAGQISADNLALHTAKIRGFNTNGGTVAFNATNFFLDNSPGKVGPESSPNLSGSLEFNASTIHLGSHQVVIDEFASVSFNATGGIIAEAVGGLTTQGALTLNAPLTTGAAASSYTVTSAGALILKNSNGAEASVKGGLGASLAFTGTTLTANSNISLPSGLISLRATNGDLVINGSLSADGTSQQFFDLTRYTNGGAINLISDHGSINLGTMGSVSVAAQSGGGDAGSVVASAIEGALNLSGNLFGKGGSGGENASFSLDAGSLSALAALSSKLDAADFDLARSIRVRTGDVIIDGAITANTFNLSADAGAIVVTGTIDASGATGGAISLSAFGDLTLTSTSLLDVTGDDFDSAGKGGVVSLETRGDGGAVLKLEAGSQIKLSVVANTNVAGNAAEGKFNGTLHLRAPRDLAGTDLQVAAIDGAIVDASSIVVEGFKVYTPAGGIIDGVKGQVFLDGQTFAGTSGTINPSYVAMRDRLFANNAGLLSVSSIQSGAEIVSSGLGSEALPIALNNSGTSAISVAGGVPITFASGTPGNNRVRFSAPGTITIGGVITPFAANTTTALAAGSVVTFNGTANGTLTFASGNGGAIPLSIGNGAQFTSTAGNVAVTPAGSGSVLQLNAANSAINLNAGGMLTFINGTVGTNRVRFTAPATITSPSGAVTTVAANTLAQVVAGSSVRLDTAGSVTFVSGGGGAIQLAVAGGSAFTTTGSSTITAPAASLILANNWDLANFRFGPDNAPGILTLRSAGNLVFNFKASLSDGFAADPIYGLWAGELLAPGSRSWSYRLIAGADLTAADSRQVRPLADLRAGNGSLLLGLGAPALPTTNNAARVNIIPNYYQTIRTGTGDIEIVAGRDVQLLNSIATIYTAGTRAATLANFDLPDLNQGNSGVLGNAQTPLYPAQYSLGGGNLTIQAQNDIGHYLQTGTGASSVLSVDSTREMPTNWLYRRGNVDAATGEFRIGANGDAQSTSWWIDFSNFFEGVGALGGGNVTLTAGRDVVNVDAFAPTNARTPKGAPDRDALVELGGGDVNVEAGRDISGGVYYVERGAINLEAGRDITTNSARAAVVRTALASSASNPTTWLPTTLFLGKGGVSINAGGNILLGSVVNPFLLPQGINNTFDERTYFSTYATTDTVEVASLSGSITVKDSSVSGAGSLSNWYQNVLLTFGSTNSFALSQPWLRLAETRITAAFSTAASLLPPALRVTSFSGDINLVGTITLAPSPTGTVDLLAAGAINGLQVNAMVGGNKAWASSTINVSDADPNAIPSVDSPFSLENPTELTNPQALASITAQFRESGSYTGDFGVIQTKQALHAPGLLHASDAEPIHLYAGMGDISGLTLFSPKSARITAANDLIDNSFYLQNIGENDFSIVSAGRDIVAYAPNSPLRLAAQQSGNQLVNFAPGLSGPSSGAPTAGDIQISGPGTLEVLAGRNFDLGVGPGNVDGTGAGLISIGNARNPYLPFEGADIVLGAGLGPLPNLGASRLDISAFVAQFIDGIDGMRYLAELTPSVSGNPITPASFAQLSKEEQEKIVLEVFYLVLRDAGRDHNIPGSPGFGTYAAGLGAIEALFPGQTAGGDITTRNRDIRTKSGGALNLFAPGGGVSLVSSAANTQAPPGIITEDGGNISIFSRSNVDIGVSRIFTLRGGDITIWSSEGNIAAGNSAKTVQSAPPTRVLIDPQSAEVQTDLAGLATGGGIGVLATVADVPPGNVDLIAPTGTVDAGDAGIQATGNLNIAAVQVLNADNIQAGGTSTGVPVAPQIVAPNLGALAAAQNTNPTANAADQVAKDAQKRAVDQPGESPSIITVEVLGYGGEQS